MKKSQVYTCGDCKNVVEVVHAGTCEPACCDAPMERLTEKHEDTGFEKHVPVIERDSGATKVKVGSVPHPMEPEHYIAWIEIIDGDETRRKYLAPGREPQAVFSATGEGVIAREYCTVHGLWGS